MKLLIHTSQSLKQAKRLGMEAVRYLVGLWVILLVALSLATSLHAKSVTVIGKIIARQSGEIAAQIGAPVMKVNVVAGDRVKKGDVLATFNMDDRKADLENAEARVQVARAQLEVKQAALELEKAKYRRLDQLKTSAAFNASQHENSEIQTRQLEAEVDVARAEIAANQAAYNRINVDIDRAVIKAPYDAIVISRAVEVGDYVLAGQKLFTLASVDELEVDADIPAVVAATLKPGMKIEASTRDKQVLEVTLRSVIPIENPLTRTRAARFVLVNAEGLAIGQSVELRLNGAVVGQ